VGWEVACLRPGTRPIQARQAAGPPCGVLAWAAQRSAGACSTAGAPAGVAAARLQQGTAWLQRRRARGKAHLHGLLADVLVGGHRHYARLPLLQRRAAALLQRGIAHGVPQRPGNVLDQLRGSVLRSAPPLGGILPTRGLRERSAPARGRRIGAFGGRRWLSHRRAAPAMIEPPVGGRTVAPVPAHLAVDGRRIIAACVGPHAGISSALGSAGHAAKNAANSRRARVAALLCCFATTRLVACSGRVPGPPPVRGGCVFRVKRVQHARNSATCERRGLRM
jgi:hypothetical protein